MTDEQRDSDARASYEAGRKAMAAGDVVSAIAHLEPSVAADPHFKSLELLGEAYMRKGEPRRAVVPLAAATTLNAQVRAPSLLAEALLALGEERDASECSVHRASSGALVRGRRANN